MHNRLLAPAVIAAALFAVSGRVFAQTAAGSGAVPPQIVTSGSGEARISPDRATISVGVQTRAATAALAGADNARRQRAILDTLRALGLTSEELSTVNYSVSPEMQYTPNGSTPPKVVGYTVSNTVRADVRRLDDVGKVIDAALAKGANEISSLEFYSSKADSVRRVALSGAVTSARADAEALAKAAGGSLGSLLELSTTEMPIRQPQPIMMSRMADAKATPIESGEQTFSASVTARWQFVPRP
ncbi:MAG TPA: SIMPL domain-containing protein [Gemmatimonadaceae bacterium]|jgi:hypothetical protein